MVSTAELGETCEATYVVSSPGHGVSVTNLHTVPVTPDDPAKCCKTVEEHAIVEKNHTCVADKGSKKTTLKTGTLITCLHCGVKSPEVTGSLDISS